MPVAEAYFEEEGESSWVAVDYHGTLEQSGWEDRISLNRLTKAGYKVWILSFASQRWRKRERSHSAISDA